METASDSMTQAERYAFFRGAGRKLTMAACVADPDLTLIRGYYFCPVWNVWESHWWTVRRDGSIYDLSAAQYPSHGGGVYVPFSNQ